MTPLAHTAVVLDFETTGLSPAQGDRAIEIGAVRLEDGVITARFQELMNPGFGVSRFISEFTGITNQMLSSAPPCEEVMARFDDFVGGDPVVAHNASFDRRFLEAELGRIQRRPPSEFGCTMLTARRLYPHAPDHKLGTLVRHLRLPTDGVFHRALADAEMAAHLWLAMLSELADTYGLARIPFSLMVHLGRVPKAQAPTWLRRQATQL